MRLTAFTMLAMMLCAVGAASAATGESGLNTGSVGAAQAGAPVYPGGKPINGGLITMTNYSSRPARP